jgi:hypothetical protein
MPWKDDRLKVVAKEFKVKGLPQLIALKRDGTLLSANAVQKITDEGPMAIEEWL